MQEFRFPTLITEGRESLEDIDDGFDDLFTNTYTNAISSSLRQSVPSPWMVFVGPRRSQVKLTSIYNVIHSRKDASLSDIYNSLLENGNYPSMNVLMYEFIRSYIDDSHAVTLMDRLADAMPDDSQRKFGDYMNMYNSIVSLREVPRELMTINDKNVETVARNITDGSSFVSAIYSLSSQINFDEILDLIEDLVVDLGNDVVPFSYPRKDSELFAFIISMNSQYLKNYERDTKRYESLRFCEDRIIKAQIEDNFMFSPNRFTSRSYTYSVNGVIGHKSISLVDLGPTIFNLLTISKRLPYASYRGHERGSTLKDIYHKAFVGGPSDPKLPYPSIFKKRKKNVVQDDVVEFIICLAPGTEDEVSLNDVGRGRVIISSYIYVTFDLTAAELSFTLQTLMDNKETGFEKRSDYVIRESFKKIVTFSEAHPTNISCEFNLYMKNTDFDFLEFAFLDFVALGALNTEGIDVYKMLVRSNERIRSIPKKVKYEYEFLWPGELFYAQSVPSQKQTTFSLRYERIYPNIYYPLDSTFSDEGSIKGVELANDDVNKYISFRIAHVSNIDQVDTIKELLLRMLSCYAYDIISVGDILNRVYNTPNSYQNGCLLTEARRKENVKDVKKLRINEGEVKQTKVQRNRDIFSTLHMRRPLIFNAEYRRHVPTADSYPEIFDTIEEAIDHDAPFERFPPEDVIIPGVQPFWFSSLNPYYYYPSVIKNTNLNSQIPYFPLMSVTNQERSGTDFNAYYNNADDQVKLRPNVISGNSFLRGGDRGKLDSAMRLWLEQYGRKYEYERYGVCAHPSPNSMIHCVTYAVRTSSTDGTRRYPMAVPQKNITNSQFQTRVEYAEEYIREVRRDILNSVHVGVARQQTYSFSDAEVKRDVMNTELFFDSSRYYCLLEEYYQINIFVIGSENNNPTMEVPSHKIFHVRNYRPERPTVLLYRNRGSPRAGKLSPFDHYELIVARDINISIPYYGLKMLEMCYSAYSSMISTVTLYRHGKNLTTYLDLYRIVNYHKLFNMSIVSQRIDSYGKVYAFDVRIYNRRKCTIFVTPTHPLNVPQRRGAVYTAPPEIVEKFVVPGVSISSVTRSDGMISGLWFEIYDVKNCFYIPTVPFINKDLDHLEESGPEIPIFALSGIEDVNVDSVDSYRTNKRVANQMKELIIWTFDTFRREQVEDGYMIYAVEAQDRNNLAERFIRQFIDEKWRMNVTYSFSALTDILPVQETAVSCIQYIASKTEGFISENGKMITNSRRFLDGIRFFVRDYYKNTYGLKPEPAHKLELFYESSRDFHSQENVVIFANNADFQLWLEDWTKNEDYSYITHERITHQMTQQTNPYMIQKKGENGYELFLVQNVGGRNRSRIVDKKEKRTMTGEEMAVRVADSWRLSGVNQGFHAEERRFRYDGLVETHGASLVSVTIPIMFSTYQGGKVTLDLLHQDLHPEQYTLSRGDKESNITRKARGYQKLVDEYGDGLMILYYGTIEAFKEETGRYAAILPLM